MDQELLKSKAKIVLKGALVTLILATGVTALVHVASGLYDHRIILAVLAGHFGFGVVSSLLDKIKVLQ